MINVKIKTIEILEETKEEDLMEKYTMVFPRELMGNIFVWVMKDRKKNLKLMPWLMKTLAAEVKDTIGHWKEYQSTRSGVQILQFEDYWPLVTTDEPVKWYGWKLYFNKSVPKEQEKMIKKAAGHLASQTLRPALYKVTRPLELFVKNIQLMKKKDINQYSSLDELEDAIQLHVTDRRVGRSIKKFSGIPTEGTVHLPVRKPFTLVRPEDTDASCRYGKGADWCIARKGNIYFSDYINKEGKLFWFLQDHSKPDDHQYYLMAFQGQPDLNRADMSSEDKSELIMQGFWDRWNEWHNQFVGFEEEHSYELLMEILSVIKKDYDSANIHDMANPYKRFVKEVNSGKYSKENFKFTATSAGQAWINVVVNYSLPKIPINKEWVTFIDQFAEPLADISQLIEEEWVSNFQEKLMGIHESPRLFFYEGQIEPIYDITINYDHIAADIKFVFHFHENLPATGPSYTREDIVYFADEILQQLVSEYNNQNRRKIVDNLRTKLSNSKKLIFRDPPIVIFEERKALLKAAKFIGKMKSFSATQKDENNNSVEFDETNWKSGFEVEAWKTLPLNLKPAFDWLKDYAYIPDPSPERPGAGWSWTRIRRGMQLIPQKIGVYSGGVDGDAAFYSNVVENLIYSKAKTRYESLFGEKSVIELGHYLKHVIHVESPLVQKSGGGSDLREFWSAEEFRKEEYRNYIEENELNWKLKIHYNFQLRQAKTVGGREKQAAVVKILSFYDKHLDTIISDAFKDKKIAVMQKNIERKFAIEDRPKGTRATRLDRSGKPVPGTHHSTDGWKPGMPTPTTENLKRRLNIRVIKK